MASMCLVGGQFIGADEMLRFEFRVEVFAKLDQLVYGVY